RLGPRPVADPRVDQQQADVVLDQHAAQCERNAVTRAGRDAPLPQRLRYDAEHGAAVEVLGAGFEGVAAQAAHLESSVRHSVSFSYRSSLLSGNVMHRGPPPPRTSSLPSIVTTPRSPSPRASC